MESFLNRYRNITVLLLVIFAQLVLLAYQVKNDQDVRVIRVWAVTMVTPAARVAEWFRGSSIGFIRNYILLKDANEENRKLREEVGRLRIENNFLHNELNTAERAKALEMFRARRQSKMLAANVIGAAGGVNTNIVYVNRGSSEGVMRGMAVVTPEGIVGKIMAAYPITSEVLLVTDPDFAAGVVSQKSLSRGILRGQGKSPLCKVDNVPFEDKVEVGEWFFTSGDDRVFPRGFAVGVTKVARPGTPFKDIQVAPSGLAHGLEDVLILLETVHEAIPDTPPTSQPVYIAAPPAPQQAPATVPGNPSNPGGQPGPTGPQTSGTEADKLLQIYKSVGDAQNHTFGTGAPGSRPPDFKNLAPTAQGPGSAPSARGLGAGDSGLGNAAPSAQGPRAGGRGTTGATGAQGPGAAGRGTGNAAPPAPGSGVTGATGSPTGGGGSAPAAPTGRGPGNSPAAGAGSAGRGAETAPATPARGAATPGQTATPTKPPVGQPGGRSSAPATEQGGTSNTAPAKGPGAPRE